MKEYSNGCEYDNDANLRCGKRMKDLIAIEQIEQRIYLIRGQKVLLGMHLAELYGVEVRTLIQAVKRNIERFPEDFIFQLSRAEFDSLRSQTVILKTAVKKSSRGRHIKYLPYAFTEQGVAMLSGVLRSKRAIQVNIAVMRAFVKLRQILSTHKELALNSASLRIK